MNNLIFIAVYLIAAVLAVRSGELKSSSFRYLKPAPLALLIIYSLFAPFNIFLILALIFSVTGDIFLLNKEKYFTYGLPAFLIAHLFYIYLFYSLASSPNPLIGLAIFAVIDFIFFTVRKSLKKYLRPVLFYMLVISFMVYFSLGFSENGGVLIGIGGILFFISDGVLALNKFHKKIKFSEIIILSTYYAAQLLIVLGIKSLYV